jgi:superfamily II DNA or RNA helicase
VPIDDQGFAIFVEQITEISAEVKVVPMPEQLAAMYVLLTSTHKRTLMQRPTGTGKSLILGLMARYLNIIFGIKVAVVVPNEVLAAIQQSKYSPWASKIGDALFELKSDIHYCTYSDFLTGNIPFGTILLVDEIDSLFFADTPTVIGNRLLSAITLLNKYKVIGMTATFRGEQGLSKMKALMNDNIVIKTETVESERIL